MPDLPVSAPSPPAQSPSPATVRLSRGDDLEGVMEEVRRVPIRDLAYSLNQLPVLPPLQSHMVVGGLNLCIYVCLLAGWLLESVYLRVLAGWLAA